MGVRNPGKKEGSTISGVRLLSWMGRRMNGRMMKQRKKGCKDLGSFGDESGRKLVTNERKDGQGYRPKRT